MLLYQSSLSDMTLSRTVGFHGVPLVRMTWGSSLSSLAVFGHILMYGRPLMMSIGMTYPLLLGPYTLLATRNFYGTVIDIILVCFDLSGRVNDSLSSVESILLHD